MNKLYQRRYHIPPEALGIGYEKWAAQFLEDQRPNPNEPQPQRPQPQRLVLVIMVVLVPFILFLACFLSQSMNEPPLPGEIMSWSLK
jgi:hypothetical protein